MTAKPSGQFLYVERFSNDCTISRLHHTAWEVMGLKDFLRKSYVAPDFRLHPSSEIGSLPFCQLGQTKCQRTDPSKIPLLLTHINYTNRLQQIKVLCLRHEVSCAFFQESDRFPFTFLSHSPSFCALSIELPLLLWYNKMYFYTLQSIYCKILTQRIMDIWQNTERTASMMP